MDSLYNMLFATATAADRPLAATADFKRLMGQVLKDCFVDARPAYLRDVQAYVAPWAGRLNNIQVQTHLWHGDQDNWAPMAMSQYLKAHLPESSVLHALQGLSHYSCLYAAAPRICAQIQHS